MSVLPKELVRKLSADTHENSERISKPNARQQRFRELMKVSAIDDKPREKHFSRREDKKNTKNSSLAKEHGPFLPPTNSDAAILAAGKTLGSLSSQAAQENASVAAASSVDFSQVEALFERIASSMILMHSAEESETTIFLDHSQFSSSIFFGSQITIREFSTAPKAFNVEIMSSAAAIAVLDAAKESLLTAFQKGNFNFSVHRIDAELQKADRPVFHRKESHDQEQQEQKGGRQQ